MGRASREEIAKKIERLVDDPSVRKLLNFYADETLRLIEEPKDFAEKVKSGGSIYVQSILCTTFLLGEEGARLIDDINDLILVNDSNINQYISFQRQMNGFMFDNPIERVSEDLCRI